jgi:Protein of unknown function (DUF3300)
MKFWQRLVVPLVVLVLAVPVQLRAQDDSYSQEELDQMLAPIALYPDPLLMNVLMASTYPDQIAAAEQWVQDGGNGQLQGDALVAALSATPWDPSVKALVAFPQILSQLADNTDWTESLGYAFADQQDDVMAQVQFLRQQAAAAGNLQSTPQMAVQNSGGEIVIQPANPAVVYVPVYDPTVIYGNWRWADSPPVYFAPPVGFVGVSVGPFGFSVGFNVVAPLWGWATPNWRGGGVIVNNNYYVQLNRNHAPWSGGTRWQHQGKPPNPGRFAPHAAGWKGQNGPAFKGNVRPNAQNTNFGKPGGGKGPNGPQGGNQPGGQGKPNFKPAPGGNQPPQSGSQSQGNQGGKPGGQGNPNFKPGQGGNQPQGNQGGNQPGGQGKPNFKSAPGGNQPQGNQGGKPGGQGNPNFKPGQGGNQPQGNQGGQGKPNFKPAPGGNQPQGNQGGKPGGQGNPNGKPGPGGKPPGGSPPGGKGNGGNQSQGKGSGGNNGGNKNDKHQQP